MTDKKLDVEIDVTKTGDGDRQAKQGIDEITGAAQQSAVELEKASEQTKEAGKNFKQAGEDAKGGGDDIEEVGRKAAGANPSVRNLSSAITGLSGAASDDNVTKLRSIAQVFDNVAKATGAAALVPAGIMAAALGVAAALLKFLEEDTGKILEKFDDIETGADELETRLQNLAKDGLKVDTVLDALDKIQERYAKIAQESARARQSMNDLATAEQTLAAARLGLDIEKMKSSASTEAEKEAYDKIGDILQQNLRNQQAQESKKREIEAKVEAIRGKEEQINAAYRTRKTLLDDLEEKKAKFEALPEVERIMSAPGGQFSSPSGVAARDAMQRAEDALIEFDQRMAKPSRVEKLESLRADIANFTTEWEGLQRELDRLGVEGQTIDVSNLKKTPEAFQILNDERKNANDEVHRIREAGFGDLEAAIQREKDLTRRIEALEAAKKSVTTRQEDASETIPAVDPERVSVLETSIKDIGSTLGDAAAESAPKVDAAGDVTSDAIRDVGTGAQAAATQASTSLAGAKRAVQDSLEDSAKTMEDGARDFVEGVGGSFNNMNMQFGRIATALDVTLNNLILRLDVIERAADQAAADSSLALSQLRNLD